LVYIFSPARFVSCQKQIEQELKSNWHQTCSRTGENDGGNMRKMMTKLSNFLLWSCKTAGKPMTFIIAWAILMLWAIIGLIWGFTDTWILAINTLATINASLMVFIIQNTQNRESKALHLKIDGIIKAIKEAENELIAIEHMEEEDIEEMRKRLFQLETHISKSKK
jgi:low affinity Fe/Cu permease